jgi:DNA segregation ATPase FtsK/SpoIIIE, S-DNA-T family
MASYNTRSRDPLLDSNLQALLQKRGREVLGLALIAVAGLVAVMLGSYAPSDPSWMSSSNVPIENSLGAVGATISSPLMIIIGKASWGLVLFCLGWGLRLVLSRGHEQALARGIFLPIALALSAVWCATLVPSAGWGMLYGMGGIFGDTVLGAIVSALPMGPAAGVTLMGVVMLAVMLAGWAYVMGVSGHEARRFLRFLLAGIALASGGLMALLRGGAARAGRAVARKVEDSRAARAQPQYPHPHTPDAHFPAGEPPLGAGPATGARRSPPVIRASGYDAPAPDADLFEAPPRYAAAPAPWEDDTAAEDTPGPGLLARLKALSGRAAAEEQPLRGELVEPQLSASALQAQPVGEARIKTRIADAIRHHKGAKPVLKFDRTRHVLPEPPLRAPVAPVPGASPVPQPAASAGVGQFTPTASLKASVDATLAPVPMPDWMLAAQPVAQPQAPQPAPQMAAPLVAEPLFQPDAPRGPHVLTRRVVNTMQRRPQPSRQAQAEAAPAFAFDPSAPVFELPPLSLLESPGEVQRFTLSDEALEENARMLENVLDDYGVRGEIVSVRPGPVVTQYELEPAPGLKASRVIGLADDIARSMSALSARVSTVPGRTIIGIELPNAHREKVVLREILWPRDFGDTNMRLPLALGKAIDGEPIVANLAKMPHLLIAGTTGSGKSVAINTMILSLLYRLTPEECRMIMIDPKMLELSVYDGIPHLLSRGDRPEKSRCGPEMGRGRDGRALSQDVENGRAQYRRAIMAACARRWPRARCSSAPSRPALTMKPAIPSLKRKNSRPKCCPLSS